MKLKELVNKIDNDIVLWIVRAPDTNVLFKRKHPFDVIPEDVLCMEVGTFFPIYNRLYIEVKRISPHKSEWGDKIEIEIEPCEEEDTQEGRNERGN